MSFPIFLCAIPGFGLLFRFARQHRDSDGAETVDTLAPVPTAVVDGDRDDSDVVADAGSDAPEVPTAQDVVPEPEAAPNADLADLSGFDDTDVEDVAALPEMTPDASIPDDQDNISFDLPETDIVEPDPVEPAPTSGPPADDPVEAPTETVDAPEPVEASAPEPADTPVVEPEVAANPPIEPDVTPTQGSALNAELPSFNPDDYDHVYIGKTFTSSVKLAAGDDNSLFIGCTFKGIDGHGVELRDVKNVTIYDCDFNDISGTAIRLRSSGSTEDVSVIENRLDNIGLNGISSAKRSDIGVDHKNLLIKGNDIGDTGLFGHGGSHAIYVQSSGVAVWENRIEGDVDANGISIRGDGIVWNNYINISSSDKYGSGIKYFSDHKSGEASKLIIADNTVIGDSNLYSGIELKADFSEIPSGTSHSDWLVNDFEILNNSVSGVKNDIKIDSRIEDASWSSIKLSEGSGQALHVSEWLSSISAELPSLEPEPDVMPLEADTDSDASQSELILF